MDDQGLIQLRSFIQAAPEDQRASLQAALDALLTAAAGQAITIRTLTTQLRNARISLAQVDRSIPIGVLGDVATALGRPGARTVSIQDAEAAARELARQASRGGDLTSVLIAIARVVSVFA
jgi:hypothetical protein